VRQLGLVAQRARRDVVVHHLGQRVSRLVQQHQAVADGSDLGDRRERLAAGERAHQPAQILGHLPGGPGQRQLDLAARVAALRQLQVPPGIAAALAAAEHYPVVGDGTEQQRGGHGRQHQAGQVEVALALAELGEPHGEWQREQEAEQDLHAQAGNPEFLEQFGEVPVVSLSFRFVPWILRSPISRIGGFLRPHRGHLRATPALLPGTRRGNVPGFENAPAR
jgi:hypothetical protein